MSSDYLPTTPIDEVVQETGWSRGRIYNLAMRVGASDQAEHSKDIHATRCLLVCADIANGSKHHSLSRPKVGGALSEATGLHLDTEKGICQEFTTGTGRSQKGT
jgi:hypothetical protein